MTVLLPWASNSDGVTKPPRGWIADQNHPRNKDLAVSLLFNEGAGDRLVNSAIDRNRNVLPARLGAHIIQDAVNGVLEWTPDGLKSPGGTNSRVIIPKENLLFPLPQFSFVLKYRWEATIPTSDTQFWAFWNRNTTLGAADGRWSCFGRASGQFMEVNVTETTTFKGVANSAARQYTIGEEITLVFTTEDADNSGYMNWRYFSSDGTVIVPNVGTTNTFDSSMVQLGGDDWALLQNARALVTANNPNITLQSLQVFNRGISESEMYEINAQPYIGYIPPVIDLMKAIEDPLPAIPINVQAIGGDTKVTVSWSAAARATSSNLYWDTSSPITTGSNKITGVTSPYEHTGRTNGVEYFYAVESVNSEGVSDLSSEVSATPSVAPAYAPEIELSDAQLVSSWRVDQMTLDKLNAGLTLREDRGIQAVKVPGAVFNLTAFPNLDAEITGKPIPTAIGVGLKGLPAYLIDSTTNTFKILNNPLVSFDGFTDADGGTYIPDVLDLATAEFTYAAWDGDTELFADVSCIGENPVDAVELLLTDSLRGANLSSAKLDTTSTGNKGFGTNGARKEYIRGHTSRNNVEKVDFSISLYMDEPKKVDEWIQQVAGASFATVYVDQSGLWQIKAWKPIVSDDMMEIDNLFLTDPKFTWKMSDPITKAVANYAKNYRTDNVQSAEHDDDELRQLRGLSAPALDTRELPLSDAFSAQYWAERTVAMRGVPRRILTCTVTQEFSLLELGDYVRVVHDALHIDGPFEVITSRQQADSMEVSLTLIDVRGFGDTVGFWMSDAALAWDNSRTDAEIKNDRENGAYWTDDGGYADTDDPKRSYEEARYI